MKHLEYSYKTICHVITKPLPRINQECFIDGMGQMVCVSVCGCVHACLCVVQRMCGECVFGM